MNIKTMFKSITTNNQRRQQQPITNNKDYTELSTNQVKHYLFERIDNGAEPKPVQVFRLVNKQPLQLKPVTGPYKLGLYDNQPDYLNILVLYKGYYVISDMIYYHLYDYTGKVIATRINDDTTIFKHVYQRFKKFLK